MRVPLLLKISGRDIIITKVGDDTKYPINKYGLPADNSISPFEEGYRLMTRRLTAALNTKDEEDGYTEE